MDEHSETRAGREPDVVIYVGENDGAPLLVALDRSFGAGFADTQRPWAVMVEVRLARVDSNAMPLKEDFGVLEAFEAALLPHLTADGEATPADWEYVLRTYGEGVARFGFYAGRNGGAERRVERAVGDAMSSVAGAEEVLGQTRVVLQRDPTWSAYAAFFPGDESKEHGGIAMSFRDDSPAAPRGGPAWKPREEQPWRGEESQKHPEE